MPTPQTKLNVVSLDRPTLRADLINFLKSQASFKDYDFAGSNISVLIDLLAYNTNKEAFLVNMLFSEAFLDSSQLLSSVLSHAKELNYLRRSATSSQAEVTVSFQATGENQPYVVPKGSSFSTLIKNSQYVFTMPETVIVSSANTTFSFTTRLYEGEYFKDGYTYAPSDDDPFPAFRVTNSSVDTDSLTVVVFEDDAVQGDTYTLATSLLDLTGDSKVYFLQATGDGFYEVLFGNNVLGKQPVTGSTIVLDYRVTVGDKANSATKFAINFDPTGSFRESSGLTVVTTVPSNGGAPPESIGSVKYNAPRWYQTQERAVTSTDYSTLLRVRFPEIQAVTAYGGEDATPPLFGRIVVSVALAGLDKLPDSRRQAYQDYLQGRMPLGMRLVFVDPLFTYVRVQTSVKYDVSVTSNSPQRIGSLVNQTIQTWNAQNLGDFGSQLLFSPLCTAIDACDPSIISDSTVITLYKKQNPPRNSLQSFSMDFQLPLVSDLAPLNYPHPAGLETAVASSTFTVNGLTCRVEDDGQGNLNLVRDVEGVTNSINQVGTVDYKSGVLRVTDLNVSEYPGDGIRFYVRSAETDPSSKKNTILQIEPSGIEVTAVPVHG